LLAAMYAAAAEGAEQGMDVVGADVVDAELVKVSVPVPLTSGSSDVPQEEAAGARGRITAYPAARLTM